MPSGTHSLSSGVKSERDIAFPLEAPVRSSQLVTPLAGAVTVLAIFLYLLILHHRGLLLLGVNGFGWWTASIANSESSQLFADPYSLSHLLFGILSSCVLVIFAEWTALQTRFLLTVFLQIGWELLENSALMIHRVRSVTIEQHYLGDSLLNSFTDTLFCIAGFIVASRLSWRSALVMAFLIEVGMLIMTKNSIALNTIMLIHPVEAIKNWQVV